MIKKYRATIILWVLMLITGAFAGGYFWLQSRESNETPPQTATATKSTLTQIVSASGQIDSSGQLAVATQATGKISKVYVEVGSSVKKGDKIVEIDPDLASQQNQKSAWATYLNAKNTLSQANAKLYTLEAAKIAAEKKFNDEAVAKNLDQNDATYKQLYAAKLAAETEYNNQSGVITQAKASVDSAYSAYQKTSSTVTAPADGVIQDISYREGTYLSASATSGDTGSSGANTSLATIKISDKLTATLNVSELDIANVKTGQDVALTLTALAGKTYHGKVINIGATGTTSSGITTFTVTIEIADGVAEMRTGMAISGDITTQVKEDVLAVPNQAITASGQNYTVKVLKNGQEQTAAVTVGLILDTQTEITSGLSEGDMVILPTSSADTTATGDSPSRSAQRAPARSGE